MSFKSGDDNGASVRDFVSLEFGDDRSSKDNETNLPRISVVMPSYQQAEFIERSILSVLNQGYPNVELIVIDGGSKDGSIEIIRKYEDRIAHWVSEKDHGQSEALNKGFALATGDVFGWLNSDDLYLPNSFEIVRSKFHDNPQKLIVHGDWLSIDRDDRVIEREYAFDFNLDHFKYEGFHLNSQAMFWRREVHRRFGKYDINLHRTMDYQMIVAFGVNEGNSAFLRVDDELACFRRHDEQKTKGESGSNNVVLEEHHSIAQQYGYVDKYSWRGRLKRIFYRFRRAYWYYKRGGLAYLISKV
jgi:glycosyltransferase involved in cell wall biosynthesis